MLLVNGFFDLEENESDLFLPDCTNRIWVFVLSFSTASLALDAVSFYIGMNVFRI